MESNAFVTLQQARAIVLASSAQNVAQHYEPLTVEDPILGRIPWDGEA